MQQPKCSIIDLNGFIMTNVKVLLLLVSKQNCGIGTVFEIVPGMTSLPNLLCCIPGHTDRHSIYTASFVKTTLAPPSKRLGCHEAETNFPSAY